MYISRDIYKVCALVTHKYSAFRNKESHIILLDQYLSISWVRD